MYVKTGKVVQVYKYANPAQHPDALAAYEASICAGEQDPKLFWEMHDWLFQNLGTWQNASDPAAVFRNQAITFGADGTKYDTCVVDPKTKAQVERDVRDGAALGVRATPAFFIYKMTNGQPQGDPELISGALPFAQFSQVIDKLLAK